MIPRSHNIAMRHIMHHVIVGATAFHIKNTEQVSHITAHKRICRVKPHNTIDVDPHIWSSPKNAYIIARNMYEAFVELDPKGRDYYRDNYERLLDRISEVDSTVTEVLGRVPGKTFAIYHPTLTYLAEDYGVVQLSLENAGKESSALYLKQVIDEARESGVSTVFVQREFNAKQVETFAAETGARVTIINPLNYDWDKEIIRIAYAIAAE